VRTYEIGTHKLPSVTTILSILRSPPLERWRGDVGNLVADSRMSDGASRGTSVHSLCEYLCKHGTAPPVIPTHLRTRYAAFAHFYDTHVVRTIDAESVVSYIDPDSPAHTPHGYAGRCDMIAQLTTGQIAAIDIKTSKVVTEKMGMQLAAYARATPHAIDTRIVIQIHANEPYYTTRFPPTYAIHTPANVHPEYVRGYDLYEFTDYTLDLYGFDSAHALFVWASRSGLLDREFNTHRT
jgi:hypothetical protein